MKLLRLLIIVATASLLSACNFTLAADITPPPDYVSPTPMPTLGALVPAAAPDVQQGAMIYAQNCAACHGTTGLGDGPQSMQLAVTVPGLGLAEVARASSPAAWFKMVTQGNLDRFMPPFVGALTDEQRWDVVAYALTLHTSADQVSQGKQLFDTNCANCADKFTDQARMAALSEGDLVALMKNGQGDIPAFGKSFTDQQAYAVAAYLRTLTFAPVPQVAAASTPPATGAAPVGTVTPGGTETAGTPASTPVGGAGTVSGILQMASGGVVPANLSVTLHGFDHGQAASSGPQEVLTLTTTANADGSYAFQNVAMPLNRIFLAEAQYAGIAYRSAFDTVQAGTTTLTLPPLKLYEKSTDIKLLKLDQVHIYTDFATAGTVQVLEIFAFTNQTDHSVIISDNGTTIPFIQLPDGVQNVGYEAGQDSAPFTAAGSGLAAVPSDKPYSIIAFFNMPYSGQLDLNQPFAIDAPSIILLIPQGVNLKGGQLTDRGPQVIQNNKYHEFSSNNMKAGQTLSFSLSGNPQASSTTGLDARQITMIAGGGLGVLLIAAGLFLYFRDRRRAPQAGGETGFDSADQVMDAILALDDLHRAGKITDEAYQERRDDLKGILRNMA
ncbi:MAG TPA: c-type cytochrome [Anaerolineales bacterium]